MAERVRFTISLEPEVHSAFVEMADASGQSLSRVVGDWLADTTEAARFVSGRLRATRRAPAEVLAELAGLQERAARETRALSTKIEAGHLRVVDGGGARSAAPLAATRRKPPSSNTGVNPPRKPLGRKP